MTRKLVNIKNVLRIIISLFVIANMVKSCAKALSYDDILDYVTLTAEYYHNNSKYQIIKQQIETTSFENQISQYASSYDSVYLYWLSGGSYQPATVHCYMFTDSDGILTGNGQLYCNGSYCSIVKPVNSSSTYSPSIGTGQQNMDGCFRTTANQENNLPGMLYTNYTIEHIAATFVGNQAMPQFTYYLGSLHTKEITYNGETVLANTLSYNYRLAPIVNVVCEDTIITSMQATLDDLELRCNDLGSYWDLTYNNSTLFKYNQLYNLRVDSVINGNIETLQTKILFVPPGTVIENNSIASYPSGDYSFNTENATNQIIDNQNNNNNEIINTINNIVGNLPAVLSGDSSGDASGDLSSGFDGGGGILGGIFSLFVPDGQFFKDYFEDLNNWFSDRLGLLYFPIELTIDFLTRCLNIDFTTQVLSVGPYVLPLNDNFELVPEIEIDFNSFLEDETVNSIHEVYLFITDGLIIFGLYRLIIKKYNNIVKNKGVG